MRQVSGFWVLTVLLVGLQPAHRMCQGLIIMWVSPYPAKVYKGAPAGVPVTTVTARHNNSDRAVTSFRLDNSGLSSYFSVSTSGVIQTARSIDRQLGFKFQFFVYATSDDETSIEWKHVMVEVTERNVHPPAFNQTTYSLPLYRFSPPGAVVATVFAADTGPSNTRTGVTVFAPGPQPALDYVTVTSSGDLLLERQPPDDVSTLQLLLHAVDHGSPPLTATTTASIVIDDVKHPDSFCLSTTYTDTTVCWKNPMPGVSNPGYVVLIQAAGEGDRHERHVQGDSEAVEFCLTTRGLRQQANYSVQVTVDTQLPVTTPAVELTFQKLGPGFSIDCLDEQFAVCNFLRPCENGATCEAAGQGGLSYTCRCPSGWQGHNCTLVDLCAMLPCQNQGHCVFQGHQQHGCVCSSPYFGQICQHYNVCAAEDPCLNGGECRMSENGTYSCACTDYFSGDNCSIPDPCRLSPCGDRGECIVVSDTKANCSCYHGFYGDRCDEIDLCQTDPPCLNGGTCEKTGNNTVECHCPPDYFGPLCKKFNMCTLACGNNSCTMTPNGQYKCFCGPGFYGDECQHYNRCHDDPCQHGTCNKDETEPLCDCDPEYSGLHCDQYRPCLSDPCQARGECVQMAEEPPRDGEPPSFVCQCNTTWWGDTCQFPDRCHEDGGVCHNGGTCRNVPPDSTRCDCPDGYYGDQCQYPDPCRSRPCLNFGTCHNVSDTNYTCSCPRAFTGLTCETPVPACDPDPCPEGSMCQESGVSYTCNPACPAETTVSSQTGRFAWPRTAVGVSVMVSCPHGGHNNNDDYASRICRREAHNSATWGQVDDSHCAQVGLAEASRRLDILKDITSNPSSLGASEVNNITSILEELYHYTLIRDEIAVTMMNVISNLANVNMTVTVDSNKEANTSDRLVRLLNNYTDDVSLADKENVTIPSPNFQLFVVNVSKTSSNVTYVPSVVVGNVTQQLDVSITLPPEAFAQAAEEVTSEPPQTRLQLIGFRKSQLFLPDGSVYSADFVQQQAVLSATVSGREVTNLSSPVVYRIRNREPAANYTCVFWQPENRSWRTEGVVTSIKSGNYTVCQSVHLTSFAVLMDPSPGFSLGAVHEVVLSYISYIGCSISIVCLAVTLLTYGLFRSLNQERSGKVLIHLCLSLLLLNVFFLVNGLTATTSTHSHDDDKRWTCTALAVVLHYLLLTALMWMVVEAVEMYRALVTVFVKYAQCYMLKRAVLAWGLPLVMVSVTLGVDRANYQTDGAFCFVSRTQTGVYYGTLVGPACLVLLLNSVIFIMVTRVLLKPRFQQHQSAGRVTPTQVRGAFTVMVLLGITWVFGPLAIKEAKLVFNYLFCVLNSLQGFLIFVLRCLYNPEARLCWLQLFRTGTLKRRRGPLRSQAHTDSSSRSDVKSAVYANGRGSLTGSASTSVKFSAKRGVSGSFSGSLSKSNVRLSSANGWHPKLNGVARARGDAEHVLGDTPALQGGHVRARSGQPTHYATITEDDRYGNGTLSDIDDHKVLAAAGGKDGGDRDAHVTSASSVTSRDHHEDGGVMEYYESIRTARKEEGGHAVETGHVSEPSPEGEQSEDSAEVPDAVQEAVLVEQTRL